MWMYIVLRSLSSHATCILFITQAVHTSPLQRHGGTPLKGPVTEFLTLLLNPQSRKYSSPSPQTLATQLAASSRKCKRSQPKQLCLNVNYLINTVWVHVDITLATQRIPQKRELHNPGIPLKMLERTKGMTSFGCDYPCIDETIALFNFLLNAD